jgi:hypothetical protein
MKFGLLCNKTVVSIGLLIRKVTEATVSDPNPQPHGSTLHPPIVLLLDPFQYCLS